MIYIIAGTRYQAELYAREHDLNPRECVIVTNHETVARNLRGRKWNQGDRLDHVGTWYENNYSIIRDELLILGVPDHLLN